MQRTIINTHIQYCVNLDTFFTLVLEILHDSSPMLIEALMFHGCMCDRARARARARVCVCVCVCACVRVCIKLFI